MYVISMKKTYEVWADQQDCSITLTLKSNIQELRSNGTLSENAKLLYSIEVDTMEEAMAVHHIKMGWEPYLPLGDAKECPKGCGSMFYPMGSGECPNCGKIC